MRFIAGSNQRKADIALRASAPCGFMARFPTCHRTAAADAYCALWTVFPKVISGLRKPIAIQAAISFNINLPE